MTERSERAGIRRILAQLDQPDIVSKLSQLTAADLTTVLMAVAEERASTMTPPSILGRYLSDRFSRPAPVPFVGLRDIEGLFISAVPDGWSWVVPSPVVPFGTHASLGSISQDWVLTTLRPNEAAADPTVALALEAGARRRDSSLRRTAEPQRVATIQRIVRAQLYESPKSYVHFSIFGLATAGRSDAGEGFDDEALDGHLSVYITALSRVASSVEIVLSAGTTGPGRKLFESVRQRWHDHAGVAVIEDQQRLPNQRYYRRACFKVNAVIGDEILEIADGGFTDWTERLLDDRHERLLISGAGLDRPALAFDPESGAKPGR